jgi:D-alanine-D-alanine ligase
MSIFQKKILLLKGGNSSEKEISYKTAASVAQSIKTLGFNFVEAELDENLPQVILKFRPDVVFNATHGTYGEDGCVQGMLEILKIPYTHSSFATSSLAMDKNKTKQILEKYGVISPKGKLISISQARKEKFTFPIIFKPNNEGSSFGITIIKNNNELTHFLEAANKDEVFLQEEFIEGLELTAGVFNNIALGVLEIKPQDSFFDFSAKYKSTQTQYIMPARIDEKMYEKVKDWALTAHKQIGCNTLSRSDFILSKDKELFFLEINTQPGFTNTSLIPKMAKYNNISFDDLVLQLIKDAKLHNLRNAKKICEKRADNKKL